MNEKLKELYKSINDEHAAELEVLLLIRPLLSEDEQVKRIGALEAKVNLLKKIVKETGTILRGYID